MLRKRCAFSICRAGQIPQEFDRRTAMQWWALENNVYPPFVLRAAAALETLLYRLNIL